MRHALTIAMFLALAAALGTSDAADLPRPYVEPPPVIDTGLCVIEAPGGYVEVYQEPRGEVWGNLPNGMIVEVMDVPFSRWTDLWVRIKPPRIDDYYGWVRTATFVCI